MKVFFEESTTLLILETKTFDEVFTKLGENLSKVDEISSVL